MKAFIYILIIISTGIAACKKKPIPTAYIFEGKVTGFTGSPIVNANIHLGAYYPGNVISGGNYYTIATAKSDKNGSFKIGFNFDSSAAHFKIYAFANDYFPLFSSYIFIDNIQNGTLSQNILLYKLSTIKISFKNTPPSSPTDHFMVSQTNEMASTQFNTFIEKQFTGGTLEEVPYGYTGTNIQGYELTKTKGDTYTVINWSSNKNVIIKNVIDSLYIPGGEQSDYNINY